MPITYYQINVLERTDSAKYMYRKKMIVAPPRGLEGTIVNG